jgi:hypothetical protein
MKINKISLEHLRIGAVSLMLLLLSAFAHSAVLAVLEIVPASEVEELTIKKAESSRDMRNIGYIAGGVLLLGGVSLHIFF